MRIVIDMQGAQTESRFRGIGRYTLSFSEAMVRNKGDHEVILALSGLFPESIGDIKKIFSKLLPNENIKIWKAPNFEPGFNSDRYQTVQFIREKFLLDLKPDVVIVSSFFEGFSDNAVLSIGKLDDSVPIAVILYDLIPYLNPDEYLKSNGAYHSFYLEKIQDLKRASLLLSISDFSKKEAIEAIELEKNNIVSISSAAEKMFKKNKVSEKKQNYILRKFGIKDNFLLYTGGSDERKNLNRLIVAYSKLSPKLRKKHCLVFAGKINKLKIEELRRVALGVGLNNSDLVFTGFVEDQMLVNLYNLCKAFVFPSWHEGFGLPALEAMQCGAPVIAANTSSLPEVIGSDGALFDPFNTDSIANKLKEVLENQEFANSLAEHGLLQAKKFSWDNVAKNSIFSLQRFSEKQSKSEINPYNKLIKEISFHLNHKNDNEICIVAECIALNEKI